MLFGYYTYRFRTGNGDNPKRNNESSDTIHIGLEQETKMTKQESAKARSDTIHRGNILSSLHLRPRL